MIDTTILANTHWLAMAAQQIGLEVGPIPPSEPTRSVWRKVLHATAEPHRLMRAASALLEIPLADLSSARPQEVPAIDEALAVLWQVFPLGMVNGVPLIATSSPLDLDLVDSLRFAVNSEIKLALAMPASITSAIEAYYHPDALLEGLIKAAHDTVIQVHASAPADDGDFGDPESAPIVELTNAIIECAIQNGASDIHIEPGLTSSTVRFRIDGTLRHQLEFPLTIHQAVVSRIKVMGKMDIAVRLRPLDGRTSVHVDGDTYDLRISTVPTCGREKAVLRILDAGKHHQLQDLDVPPLEASRIRDLLGSPEGMVLVTGPTGSGKTTTLYAALRELSTGIQNITTVEDPIEYRLPGITQIQVEPKQGLTFGQILRHILRQDPDVILIGELRDEETTDLALRASLTGHLVLATVHSNSAVATVPRLVDLGASPHLVAQTLRGVIAQRLARRLCGHCGSPNEPCSPAERRLGDLYQIEHPVVAPGCRFCNRSGFRGRLPLMEVLVVNSQLRELIEAGASQQELLLAATADGMRPLSEVALDRVREGETTLSEAMRVVGMHRLMGMDARERRVDADADEVNADPLSGVLDRPTLLEAFEGWRRRGECGLSVALVTLDQLGDINAAQGMEAGDRLIRGAATAIEGVLTPGMLIGRWRAGELVVLMPNTSPRDACHLLEQGRTAVRLKVEAGEIPASTLTAAVRSWATHPALADMLCQLDVMIKQAKQDGGDRVVLETPGASLSVAVPQLG